MMLLIAHCQSQHEVDNDGGKQGNGQNSGTQPVVEAALAPKSYAPCAPVEGEESVDHSHHGNEGEEAGGNLANLVAEVEQANREAAEDDGEVEP